VVAPFPCAAEPEIESGLGTRDRLGDVPIVSPLFLILRLMVPTGTSLRIPLAVIAVVPRLVHILMVVVENFVLVLLQRAHGRTVSGFLSSLSSLDRPSTSLLKLT
jgi:hypothetical protein